MRTFKSQSGPFAEKPYYTPNDVEAICAEELWVAGLSADFSVPSFWCFWRPSSDGA